ncbi:stage II sporulation protein R [Bacillus sp. FJAT-44742]|uniref:stage II sporulation protein R n=1 Tax=Bacillus sp. FJAT-44742 TaxID=2014005 RepID=UPI000C24DC4F|nr:stage II sporulation protein R [Bacillus sp. FJAT-44742]
MQRNVFIYIIIIIFILLVNWEGQQFAAVNAGEEVIPDDAIRLRILAHSDAPVHQLVKREVRDEVNAEIREIVTGLDNKGKAREAINEHLPVIEEEIQNVLDSRDLTIPFEVELRKDVEFPTRVYGPLVYPAGDYEALVVTLGEGKGENWWCVLFPPLCFLDFSKEDKAEEKEQAGSELSTEEPEVAFFFVEKFKEWFGQS